MCQTKFLEENQNTNFKFSNFFQKGNMEKCCRVCQATNNKMVHVHCMLHTYGYKHSQNTQKPELKRPLGKRKDIWEDNTKADH